VTTHDNLPVAAAASVDGDRWLAHLDDLMDRIAVRLSRIEPRRRARQLVLGLLSELPRENCWTIAEHVGDRSPDGLQHLLAEARWDHDGVRDDLRDYVVAGRGAENAVLVVDLCRRRHRLMRLGI
jgi:SRSO17 transposase